VRIGQRFGYSILFLNSLLLSSERLCSFVELNVFFTYKITLVLCHRNYCLSLSRASWHLVSLAMTNFIRIKLR